MEEANRLLPVVRRADAIVNKRSGSVVEIEEFPEDFGTYMRTDINWSRLEDRGGESHVGGWVFWSRQDDRRNPLPVSDLENVDLNRDSSPNLKDRIRLALGKIILHPRYGQSLVQFWAGMKIDGRTLLTTKDQPFALCKTGRSAWGLCDYRMKSMKYKFYGDIGESGEEELGLPGRVFLYKLSESVPDVQCYSFEEYPQHHDASHCRVRASWALPVFEHSSQVCAGVLELVSAVDAISDWHDKSFLRNLYSVFQEVGLQSSDVYKHYEMKNDERCLYVQTIQASHELLKNGGITSQHGPLDQPSFDAMNNGMDVYNEGQDDNFGIIAEGDTTKTQEREHKKTGVRLDISLEDVLRFAALSLRDAARGLKVSESTLKCVCRKYGIHRWPPRDSNKEVFPEALPNVDATVNGPHDASIDHSWPSNSHLENESILETNDLQHHLGRRREDVSVSTMKRIRGQPGITWWPYRQNGAAMTRLDSLDRPSMDAVNNGRSFIGAECSNLDIGSEEGSVIAQERKKRKTGVRIEIPLEDVLKYSKMTLDNAARKLKVSSSTLKRVCRQYGIHRWPPRNIDNANVPLLENPRPSPDVPPRNIDKVAQPSCVELQDGIPQSTSNMPSNQVSDSRDYRIHPGPPPNINKAGGPWPSHVEYQEGISLLTCDMPSNEALDWPPRNINKVGSTKSSLVQHEEGISQLVSDTPSNQVLDSVAHVKPCDTTFQEAEMVTIKAKYVNGHTIKFKLSMWPKLEELRQQVAKRLNLRAETYDIMYDEDGERIQIACDEDLHLCIRSSRALGKNSIVVLLLSKKPITPLV